MRVSSRYNVDAVMRMIDAGGIVLTD